MKERNFRIDNMRAILIFLVVFGHLLEIMPFQHSNVIYQFVYVFHMPGFALLSGLCWKKGNTENVFRKLIYPYMVFQTLYTIFQYYVLKNEVTLQYTVPYWLMWYLLALAMWELLAASIKISKRNGIFIIFATAIISLLIGYDNNVGYFLSFSRMMVLLPFFMLGIWLQNYPDILTRKYSAVMKGIGIVGICLCGWGIYLRSESIKSIWLYHSYSYATGEYSLKIRCVILLLAVVILGCIMVSISNRKIKMISYVGQNTMPVFLVHGFVIRWLSISKIPFDPAQNGVLAPVLAITLIMILVSPPVVNLVKVLTTFHMVRIKDKSLSECD